MTMQLEGKVAVITGGSRGIGAGVALAFLRQGMRVAVCARSRPSDGTLCAGSNVLFAPVDVRDPVAVDRFADEAAERFGVPDLWVNNAGLLAPIGMARSVDSAAFRLLMEVNVLGVFHGTRSYLRLLRKEAKTGTLVNISSGASKGAYEGWSAYCASKAAVDHFTRVTALEEPDQRIYALAPGIVDTGMQDLIRQQTEAELPMVQKFRDLHEGGALLPPSAPASALARLAFGERLELTDPIVDGRDTPALRDLPPL